jgi:predicted ATPase
MLTHLRLERFKNFKDAKLSLGPLTPLVGTNASGKSNIRDAFRFLHGVGRGYTIAEIIGQKYGESGEQQWRGIRGGTRQIAYDGSETFALELTLNRPTDHCGAEPWLNPITYRIEVEPESASGARVVGERLYTANAMLFDSDPPDNPLPPSDKQHLVVRIQPGGRHRKGHVESFVSNRPVLSQLTDRLTKRRDDWARQVSEVALDTLSALESMRFLDLSPDAMRLPSFPGQTVLGDRGENLSSVLQSICEQPGRKEALVQWVQELTPMDVTDFDFPSDQIGRILVTLIEEGGQLTSAYSASDGTLRFLAMIAALLGPEPAQFYFYEELENGLHPTRLHLLLQFIEQEVQEGITQMLATTHSPQLLSLLSPEALEHASLVYRIQGASDGRIKRILDIPEARRVLEKEDIARLHAFGWLEDAISFLEGEAAAA